MTPARCLPLLGLLCSLAALSAPAAAATQSENDLLVTTAYERLRLPTPATQVAVEGLGRRVRVFVTSDAAAFAAVLRPQLGRLCPRVTSTSGEVDLECLTTRLDARLVRDGPRAFLDLRQLRGLPWKGADAAPVLRRIPASACPGRDAVAKAECAFHEGDGTAAARRFQKLLDDPSEASFAALRLGDLALEDDDVAEAIRWWKKAGEVGPWARLAKARLCEADGRCLGDHTQETCFDSGGMTESALDEMELRRWRALAFGGNVGDLATAVLASFRNTAPRSPCIADQRLCRHLLHSAMERPSTRGADEALEVYLQLPERETGPLSVDLAISAAAVAELNGAPAFGAGLLAAVTARVPAFRQPEYLARTLGLYVAGRDLARARVIANYAKARLPPALLRKAPWPELIAGAGESPLVAPAPPGKVSVRAKGPPSAEEILGPRRADIAKVLADAKAAVEFARGENTPDGPPRPADAAAPSGR
jgi:hypothetical protein